MPDAEDVLRDFKAGGGGFSGPLGRIALGPVLPGETYAQRINWCGCRGVPDGIHLPGCAQMEAEKEPSQAPLCGNCGYRTKPTKGRCAACGAELQEENRGNTTPGR